MAFNLKEALGVVEDRNPVTVWLKQLCNWMKWVLVAEVLLTATIGLSFYAWYKIRRGEVDEFAQFVAEALPEMEEDEPPPDFGQPEPVWAPDGCFTEGAPDD